jgi:hypothetical protein
MLWRTSITMVLITTEQMLSEVSLKYTSLNSETKRSVPSFLKLKQVRPLVPLKLKIKHASKSKSVSNIKQH